MQNSQKRQKLIAASPLEAKDYQPSVAKLKAGGAENSQTIKQKASKTSRLERESAAAEAARFTSARLLTANHQVHQKDHDSQPSLPSRKVI